MRLVIMLVLIAATNAFAQQPRPRCDPNAPGYFVIGVQQVDSLTSCNQPMMITPLGAWPISAASASNESAPKRAAAAPGDDPLAAYLFPPELIMAHQSELGLQDAQRAAMTTEIQKAQARFVELQWKMSAETEHLKALLEPPVVDEAQVLEEIDRTLAVERDIKRIQVTLLVRIKNTLTPSQQAKLAELREKGRPTSKVMFNIF